MIGEDFTRPFVRLCAICYKNGALDMAESRDESDLIRLKENTKYPNMYGTIKNCSKEWNEWRFDLLSVCTGNNDFTQTLLNLKGNKTAESIILRVCQQFYNHGADDYVRLGMPMSAASIRTLSGAFELKEGGFRRLPYEKMTQKIHQYVFERMAMDKEFIEDYCGGDNEVGRKSHALGRATYDKFSKRIWLSTKKNEWYDF